MEILDCPFSSWRKKKGKNKGFLWSFFFSKKVMLGWSGCL